MSPVHANGDAHHAEEEEEAPRMPYTGERPPFERIPMPSMASEEYKDTLPAFDSEKAMPPPRNIFERFSRVLQLQYGQDPDIPILGSSLERKYDSWFDYITSPISALRPRNYVDAYTRPNPCPEEYWWASWRWPRTKYVNPKVPPPVDGKYNDYYHYLAYKNWLERERDVYVSHANLVNEMTMRCLMKEGQYNAAKNCRHLYNKGFAMSRMEELNQALLYMAITGNAAIRETPYPKNFVEEKRKIYDDWLFRTRMKKPGDVVLTPMYALWEGDEDENEITLQECTRIQRLARAVDELVAWDFIMDEKEIILTELEKTVAVAEREIFQAEKSLDMQRRRCALLPVSPHNMDEGVGKRQPHAARGDNAELSALWSEHGNKFIEQYERHLARYKRVWHELLEEAEVTSSNTTTNTTKTPTTTTNTTTTITNAVKNNTNKNDEVK